MDPFLGEIRLMSFAFPPKGWALCDGSLLPISQNTALFSLLNTMYGGDGRQTFGLPDLRGRVPLAVSSAGNEPLASKGGAETVTLTTAQIPAHAHLMQVSTQPGDKRVGNSTVLATSTVTTGTPVSIYTSQIAPASFAPLNPASIGSYGGGAAHPNVQPFLVLNFCIAIVGLYPPHNY